jgi:hypothetical protein
MWRLTVIALAAMLGASAVVMSEANFSSGAAVAVAEAPADLTQMRVCLGPARVTLGGEPFVGLAFGGDGCDRRNAHVVGVRILNRDADVDEVRRAVRDAARLLEGGLGF